LMEALVDQ